MRHLAGASVSRPFTILVAIPWLILGSGHLAAQEESECELVGSPEITEAAEAIQKAEEATDPAEAEAAYREALEAIEDELNDEHTPYILAAQAHIALGNYEEANRLLTRFEELAPECIPTHAKNTRYNAWVRLYNEGIQAYQANDTDAALEAFDMANTIYGEARSYNNAAILYEQRGDTEKAIENYRGALGAEGDAEQKRSALIGLAELLTAQGRPNEAIEAYESYLGEHPDDVVIRIRYALALSDTGQAEQAAGIFEEVLGRDDLTAQQWVQVGVGLFNSKQYADAATAFGKARVGNPYGKEAMENYVNASVQAGDAAAVTSLADSLVTWYPYDGSEYQLWASTLARSGNDEQALRVLQDAEQMPIVFHSSQMAEVGENQYVVRGVVENRQAEAGRTVTIPFEFLSSAGEVIASESLDLQLPAAGETQAFRLDVQIQGPVAGFRYSKAEGL